MIDFKNFLDKVLAPIRAKSKTRTAQPAPEGDAQPSVQSEPYSELERRYVEAMNSLLADARKHDAVSLFTDIVTWKLAVVADHWGPRATADIVRRLGGHLWNLAETAEAQREADEAKAAGRLPN